MWMSRRRRRGGFAARHTRTQELGDGGKKPRRDNAANRALGRRAAILKFYEALWRSAESRYVAGEGEVYSMISRPLYPAAGGKATMRPRLARYCEIRHDSTLNRPQSAAAGPFAGVCCIFALRPPAVGGAFRHAAPDWRHCALTPAVCLLSPRGLCPRRPPTASNQPRKTKCSPPAFSAQLRGVLRGVVCCCSQAAFSQPAASRRPPPRCSKVAQKRALRRCWGGRAL